MVTAILSVSTKVITVDGAERQSQISDEVALGEQIITESMFAIQVVN
jgi:hypothetical protein